MSMIRKAVMAALPDRKAVVQLTRICPDTPVPAAVTLVGAMGGPLGTAFTELEVAVPAAFVTRTAIPYVVPPVRPVRVTLGF